MAKMTIPILVISLLVFIAFSPAASATLPAPALLDSSGNGRHLTQTGNPLGTTSPTAKYGHGADFNGEGRVSSTDPAFRILGDLSIFVSFNARAFAEGMVIEWGGASNQGSGEAVNIVFRIAFFVFSGDNRIAYLHQSGPLQTLNFKTLATGVTLGDHTLFLKRATVDNSFVVELDGVNKVVTPYAFDPTGGGLGQFDIGANSDVVVAQSVDGIVYEARVWDSLVATGTLQAMADPLDPAFTQAAEGTEIGLYFFEHACIRSQAQGISIFFASIGPYALILVVMMAVVFAVVLFVIGKVKV